MIGGDSSSDNDAHNNNNNDFRLIRHAVKEEYGLWHYNDLLMEGGINVNAQDEFEGRTALHWACSEDYDLEDAVDVADLLIEHGADIHIKDRYGITPFQHACRKCDVETSKFLIDHGADVNAQEGHGNWTPLHWVCTNGHWKVAKLLLENGANVNVKNKVGETPLNKACFYDRSEIIRLLIEHGADANTKDHRERAPLLWVCNHQNLEMAKFLIDNGGANVNAKNYQGETAMHIGFWNWKMMELLLSRGAEVDAISEEGYTPLDLACEYKKTDTVWFLVRWYPRLVLEPTFGI